jgi:hypothetical protein
MRLGEINKAASRQNGPAPHGAEAAPAEQSASSRALVALAPAAASRAALQTYRPAPFLAHLLAMKGQHPQTRERRRAEPAETLAAYRATAELAEH